MSRWEAIAVDGTEETARAFVAGFLAGRGRDPRCLVFADDVKPVHTSFGERVRDWFGRGTHQVALMPSSEAEALAAVLAAGGYPGLTTGDRQPVADTAAFTFRAETPSPESAVRIRDTLLRELPPGVMPVDVREEGEIEPESHGVHLYAPSHEFLYRAEGTFRGDLPEIVALRRRAAALDFVAVGPLEIESIG